MTQPTHPLRAYRDRHKLDLADLARRAAPCSVATLSKIENRQQNPSLELRRRLVAATYGEVTLSDLVGEVCPCCGTEFATATAA